MGRDCLGGKKEATRNIKITLTHSSLNLLDQHLKVAVHRPNISYQLFGLALKILAHAGILD